MICGLFFLFLVLLWGLYLYSVFFISYYGVCVVIICGIWFFMALRKYDQYQTSFEVSNLVSKIPSNHGCFLVDDLVESLDFDKVHQKFEGTVGQPAYNRKALLKIDLMGAWEGILSSRKLEEQTKVNDVYRFLSGGDTPCFKTICYARKENKGLYKEALLKLVATGKKLGITTFKHISGDGSTFKANASLSNLFSEKDLEIVDKIVKRRFQVDENEDLLYGDKNHLIIEKDYHEALNSIISMYIQDTIEKNDIIESNTEKNEDKDGIDSGKFHCHLKKTTDDLADEKYIKVSKKVKKVANRILSGDKKLESKLIEAKKMLRENEREKVNLTDPECFTTKNKKKIYESLYNVQFTVDYDSKMILNVDIADAPTDHNQLIPMVENLVDIYGLEQLQESSMSWDSAYGTGEALNYLEEKQINAFIPNKYQASQSKNKDYGKLNPFHKHHFIYNFQKDEYICPENQTLKYKNQYKNGQKVYYNTIACKNCKSRYQCIKNREVRIITAYKHEQAMQRMKLKMEKPESQEEYTKRAATAESPIGNIKHNQNFNAFTGTGRPYAEYEMTKISVAHNLTILHNATNKNKTQTNNKAKKTKYLSKNQTKKLTRKQMNKKKPSIQTFYKLLQKINRHSQKTK